MAEHRVPMLTASLGRHEDPERSADPRIRQLVADLRTLDAAPAPRAHFRAELRAQLVAVAPRLVAEGTHADAPRRDDGRHLAPAGRTFGARLAAVAGRLRAVSPGRPIAIVTAVVAVFALLLGGAVWVSNKSLPGDALYALKRANENVKLSLAGGSTARAKQYLDFASTRADEAGELLKRASATAAGSGATAGAAVSGHTRKLIASTLDSADDDTRSASQLLGGESVRTASRAPLAVLISWAPGQLRKLQAVTDRIPAGALHDRAAASAQLVRAAAARAAALQRLAGCSCLGSAATDQLGPVPCRVCDLRQSPLPTPAPGSRQPATTTKPGGTGTKAPGGGSAAPGGASAAPSTPPAAGGTSGGATGGGTGTGSTGAGIPGLPVPSVTVQVPTLLPGTSTAPATSTSPFCILIICVS